MDLMLAFPDGREIGPLNEDIDIDIGSTNDFEFQVEHDSWDSNIGFNDRLYIPNTEYGGLILDIKPNSKTNTVTVSGDTWRGLLTKSVIEPDSGNDYLRISGELNNCIQQLLIRNNKRGLFEVSSESTGISVSNFQFDRYCTLLDGIQKMLKSVNYKLHIEYICDSGSYVKLSAVPIADYGNQVELSQDQLLHVSLRDYRRGINHLICLGSGELAARTVIHLYADSSGNISTTQTIFGIDERTEIYDYPNAQNDAELLSEGIKHMQELLNYRSYSTEMSEYAMAADYEIGDTIAGRDYLTGFLVVKPIADKIIKITNGLISVEYKLEGEN
jgi:hypothetical protein